MLMSTLSTAGPALERRLDEWIAKADGLIVVHQEGDFYAVPEGTPWVVRCGGEGVGVSLGPWIGQSDGSTYPAIQHELTTVRLKESHCRGLVAVVGRKMISATSKE